MTTETPDRIEDLAGPSGFGDLYARVQRFYAHQMQLFDLHDADGWAATFTEDAVFSVPTLDEPVRGRPGLVANVLRNRRRQEDGGEQHRHWIGMLDVRTGADGVLHTRCYALVHATPRGGDSRLLRVCVMEDELVRDGGEWQTRRRVVTRDDLA
ncbi:nuclear transport factor 2 family protein [Streptomyces parvulus]|uniref:Hydroxylacyl-CoA dehydrogenase n=1 Tax=Streptomyces parvulus TaxID=146923 RepID=A0A191VAD5_9ACTN|nr:MULTISPECIES: nuclear transport factor 2 family protein [Streptomyces]ANJ11887.1 hydroxylacyl-CoA dehydrogenase [Streptomyces parvulus]MCC9157485.1 nuclear transport factor 2 family protein [Streptomyces parvulus]MCE7691524.1 nuclear transport factor 2 family protein [Streptomyces parvulus]MCQ4193367.1 nuclear transport factor 2 family protein [Streptomyces parvulus]MZD54098.1 nuclear transport factor 2 family protein [Streptomyces sp. SID5606]